MWRRWTENGRAVVAGTASRDAAPLWTRANRLGPVKRPSHQEDAQLRPSLLLACLAFPQGYETSLDLVAKAETDSALDCPRLRSTVFARTLVGSSPEKRSRSLVSTEPTLSFVSFRSSYAAEGPLPRSMLPASVVHFRCGCCRCLGGAVFVGRARRGGHLALPTSRRPAPTWPGRRARPERMGPASHDSTQTYMRAMGS